MSSFEVLTGGDESGEPINTYNEAHEIKVRKILSEHIELGEEYNKLLYELLEYISNIK